MVTEDDSRALSWVLGKNRLKLRIYLSGDEEDIREAVIVQVEHPHTPTDKAALAQQPGLRGDIDEIAFALIAIKLASIDSISSGNR